MAEPIITGPPADKTQPSARPNSATEIFAWRKELRARLIADRLSVDPVHRQQHAGRIARPLSRLIEPLTKPTVSLYWPFRGEPDLRPLMRIILENGGRCALPVVIDKKAPLVFRLWKPGDRLESGVWNIPIPVEGAEALPDVVVAPVVGFDRVGYRLGYSGGFFDRTLASLPHRPLAIGVGYEAAAVRTIYPLPHDVTMDAIARGTWLAFANKDDFKVLAEGDDRLFNQYGVILVNPEKHRNVKAREGQAFINWLTGTEGQAAIGSYKIDGQQLFFPNARPQS